MAGFHSEDFLAARDIFTALQVRDFRWLWIGSLGSSFAMNMQIIARGWLVYTLTSSALDLAWVTLSFMVPQVAFSLWGGVMADRIPKKRIIVLAQSMNCIATIVFGLIIFTDRIEFWDFIWFGFFNGTVLALSMPARQAFVPELIPERLIFTAMALTTTSWNLSRIVGPAFAGFMIAFVAAGDTSSTYGVGIVYFIIASLYFVSAATMLLVSARGMVKEPDDKSALTDVADGLRYVWSNPPVFGLILLSVVPFLFGMPLNTLLPAFNEDILGGGPEDLGLLMSSMGVGAIIGSLMLAAMGELRHKGAWLIATCVGWGAFTIAVGWAQTIYFAAAMVGCIGWLSSWNMSLNRGLLQLQIDSHMRGRIMSIDMMSHGLMPLGVIPISIIAERYDVATALMVAGAAFVTAILLMTVLSQSVRRVEEGLEVRV
ncbi:MAG: MFS transporter [Gammaproteobacteria bacterium]|nr:MFS transporter [Gammaproteobacteria bacterium]